MGLQRRQICTSPARILIRVSLSVGVDREYTYIKNIVYLQKNLFIIVDFSKRDLTYPMIAGQIRKFFFPPVPIPNFDKGYFVGDHDALVLDEPNELGCYWQILISSTKNYSLNFQWFGSSRRPFKGYLLYDKKL